MSKNNLSIVMALALLLGVNFSQAATPFSICMKRTKNERAVCQSGCGMIVESCYEEAIAAIDAKTSAKENLLFPRLTPVCNELVSKYAVGASQLTSRIISEARTQPGWLGSELGLRLAQQRLETVEFIQAKCK